jgi:oligopeptide/dipeptide ABC transporter ATP-binding protein
MIREPNGESGILLEIDRLEVTYTTQRGIIFPRNSVVRAVRGVSLQIFDSEIVSLVGESGSGKTTIAKCIMQLAPVTAGAIRYRGVDVVTLRGAKLIGFLKEVQMIFQDPFESLNPRQDVYTTISIPLRRLVGERDESKILQKISSLLSEVGLNAESVMYKLPHQLSGGERQRVSIARALASDPKLLIADEPITMLDASQRLNVLSLLMELKMRRNLTILIITHDLASAKAMSDRTAVMYRGNLVELGQTQELLSRPNHPYTELILSATPRLKAEEGMEDSQVYVKEDVSDLGDVSKGCVYLPRCKYATEICKKEEPPLTEKSRSHLSACYNPLNMGS